MDAHEIRDALDDVLDQALLFHGFADHMRDYDLFIHASADRRTGVTAERLRYRFTHCVRASATTAVRPDVWSRSLGDELVDYEDWKRAGAPEGYVWGVKWQCLYPGPRLVPESDEAKDWASRLGIPFHHVIIEADGHNLELVFSDLRVSAVAAGAVPWAVPGDGLD